MSKFFSPVNMSLLVIITGIGLSFTSFSETSNFLFISFIIMLIVLFIHELGHVIGGKLAGYQFVHMTVGPITIEKVPTIKISANTNWVTFGGVASCIPIEIDLSDMVNQHKKFVAGGPIATLLAFIISLVMWFITQHDIAMLFTILHLAIFAATVSPSKGTFRSDGSVLLTLHKGGKEAETYLAGLILLKELMSPKKPQDWEEQLIEEAQHTKVSIDTVQTAFLLFYYHLVTGNYEKASRSIASFKNLPVTTKTKLNLQFITHIRQIDYFLSFEPNVQVIKELHLQMSNFEPISYKRSEAMVAYLEGDKKRAYQLLEEVIEKCTKGSKQYGFFEAERELTQVVKQQLAKRA